MTEDLIAALEWSRQIKRGEGLCLYDLCLSTVQRHVRELVQAIESGEIVRASESDVGYQSLCPVCGTSLILHKLEKK